MRAPAIVAAVAFGVLAAGAAFWTGGRALSPHKTHGLVAALAGPSPSPAITATAPDYPAEAAQGLVPHPLPRADGGNPCDDRHRGQGSVDPGTNYPDSVEELGRRSALVVLATTASQKSYWHHPVATAGTILPWTPPGMDGLQAVTATNFRVDRAVKGSADTFVQVVEPGAPPGSLACSGAAIEWSDEHISKVGLQYVLFLNPSSEVAGRYKLSFLTFSRFVVTEDGLVHSAAEGGDLGLNRPAEPLTSFVARIK
jgi:hypothetical protein